MRGYAGSRDYVGNLHGTPAQNSQREDRSPVFQWGVWVGVGSSTKSARSLRIPETRLTQSYLQYDVMRSEHFLVKCGLT